MRFHSNRIILGIFFLICGNASWAASQEPGTVTVEFAGKFAGLRPEQKHLVDDWFKRFSETIKKPVKPEEGYDLLPLSLKTTFNAVTHALMQTRLTDASGASLGDSAVTLIDKLDNVVGKVPGAGGDKQFRMYAQLKPGALDILAKSKEFKRGPDNTVYHKGYPVCYRSTGGTPSIQFSTTKDGSRADVDVDYRSSKFPVFLINGHLTASNSDVRAGKNDQLHNQQWAGMQNWWRNLLGLPLVEKDSGAATGDVVIAQEPVKRNAKPAEAIHDFLNLWLVEQKPAEALGYFAEQCSACLELERGEKVDRGMAKVAVLVEMQELNRQLGKLSSLSEAILSVRLTGPRAKMIEQPYGEQFVLYDVREDLAEQFNCVNRLDTSQASSKAARSEAFGKYVGAVFRLKSKVQTGETVATLWQKEKDYWKMISYDIEPEFDKLRVPNTTPAAVAAAPALALVAGDQQLVQATKDFLEKWLLRKQVDEAFQYLSPRSYSCVNLYRDEEIPEPKSPEEAGQLTRRGMERMASTVAHARKLEDAIMAPELNDPDIKLVKHSAQKAYVIASIPDYMAAIADCANRKPGEEPDFRVPDGAKNYGSYYGVGFKLAKTVGDPGVLWTAWNKEGGAWKILSYVVITP